MHLQNIKTHYLSLRPTLFTRIQTFFLSGFSAYILAVPLFSLRAFWLVRRPRAGSRHPRMSELHYSGKFPFFSYIICLDWRELLAREMAFQSSYLWFLAILLCVLDKSEGRRGKCFCSRIAFVYYKINKIICIKIQ